jgi:hypothetical protein
LITHQNLVNEGNGTYHGTVELVDGSVHIWRQEQLPNGRTRSSLLSAPKSVLLEEFYQGNKQHL